MASVNKVILVGNLGKDPDVRYLPDGGAVVNLALATSSSWKDKNTGEKREETEWHRVVIYGRLAEIAGEYCKKGRSVYIEGRLKTRKWQDQSGVDKYTTEIIADQMQLLGGRESGGGSSSMGGGDDFDQSPAPSRNSGGGSSMRSSAPAPQRSAPQSVADLDDAVGQHLTDHGHVPELHLARRLEAENGAGLRLKAGLVLAGGLLPPGPGVAEDLHARDHPGEGHALPVGVRKGAARRGQDDHSSGRDGTEDELRPFHHAGHSPTRTVVRDSLPVRQ